MLFSSISFLYVFLPVVILLYMLVPGRGKNIVLLLASLFFYAWGEIRYLLLMVGAIALGYVAGLLIEKMSGRRAGKLVLAAAVLLCLGILGIFKYADFFISSFNQAFGGALPLLKLALPIGISFYMFQVISYMADVYRGRTEAQKNPLTLAVYIAMFPQLIAGPIVRYTDVKAALTDRQITAPAVSEGITRFAIGLGKKVLIANTLGELCAVYRGISEPTVLFTWLYAAAVTLQIYFDFSGYSDMAIGLGRVLGFSFPENFRHPLTAGSVTDFWRRWHITLGSWFRDYLYIPLGGNRVAPWRHILNIFVVWMATGFWHGAGWNFIIWGLFFAVLLIIEKYGLLKHLGKWRVLSHFYLILTVGISFIIFDNDVLAMGLARIGSLFGAGGIPFSSAETLFYLKDFGIILLIAVLGATRLPLMLVQKLKTRHEGAVAIVTPFFNAALILLATAFIVNGSFNPFLYFRF
ncbi:MAG: MBOAT family O-acyltransferase [Lachnospiraceae bacterium]|nr:MBOAT family O-acyltransferase [Lachnospiraceae bacterium]